MRDYFSWASAKDHLIPFFHYLVKDFKIQDTAKGHNPRGISFVSYDSTGTVNEHIDVDEILNDEIADDKQVAGLSIYVKSEYFI
jgi:hypothetical protein